jgi:acetyltransferase-like isoleucine patch superfamily enzyme
VSNAILKRWEHRLRGRFLRVRARLRRKRLLLRIKAEAWLAEAEVEVLIRPGVSIGRDVRIEVKPRSKTKLTILEGSKIGDDVRLRLWGGEIFLGETVDVRAGAILSVGGGTLRLDGFNNLSWGVVIHCANSVHLHKFAHVAEFSTIVDSSHFYTSPDKWSYHNVKTRPVVLGEDVWVCPKATITSGVTIGDHTIVGANSCVTKDVPSGVLVSGVPAQVVKDLDLPWKRTPSGNPPVST